MTKRSHTIFKDKSKIEELIGKFKSGIKIRALAKEYEVDRKTIHYHLIRNNLISIKSRKRKKKKKVIINKSIVFYKPKTKKIIKPAVYIYGEELGKNYSALFMKEEEKKEKLKKKCEHKIWIKKCSCCGELLENEKGEINGNEKEKI